MRLTHLGHSCLLVEMADRRILIDPGNFSDFLAEAHHLDAVVVTHQHPDHLDVDRLDALVAANPRARYFADPQSAPMMRPRCGEVSVLRPGEFEIGEVRLTAVGDKHAFNHDWAPIVDNSGVVLRADGEPSVFHPGDAYDADPGEIDLLACPVNAPWTAVRDTLAFVSRVAPRQVVPIHDGLLGEAGRAMYLGHIASFAGGGQGVSVLDPRGKGAVSV